MTTWRTGPLAITGADGQVGRALQARLSNGPNEVRPLGRGADLGEAFRDAEVVVHLAGTLLPRRPNTYKAANLDTVLATVAALEGSTVERVVFLSFITADPRSSNAYLHFKGAAEHALRSCGVGVVIFRADHIFGPPAEPGPTASAFLAKEGKVRVLGSGTQRLAPIYRDDVVEAIAHSALDSTTPAGTYTLAGPETMTAAEFARQLNPPPLDVRSTPPWLAKLLALVVPSLSRPLVEVMLSDTVTDGDPAATAETFGVVLHRVAEIWSR